PGSTAPEASFTRPAIVACAHTDCAAKRHASTKNVRTHTRILCFLRLVVHEPRPPRQPQTRPGRTLLRETRRCLRERSVIVYRALPHRVSSETSACVNAYTSAAASFARRSADNSAPWVNDRSFAQAISGCTGPKPAKVPKP